MTTSLRRFAPALTRANRPRLRPGFGGVRSGLGGGLRAALLWWRAPWRTVLGAALAAGTLHLVFLSTDLLPDEGGYLVVARHWDGPGPFLYGHFWVDRPPGLLVLFHLAGGLGQYGVRAMACVMAVVLVLSAGWAGWAAFGRMSARGKAARWAAIVAAALGSSALLGAKELDGELLAAPVVMLSVAMLLHALSRGGRGWKSMLLAGCAGAAAVGAVLVKQNFADGLAFAGVLLVMHLARRWLPRRRVLKVAGAYALGAAGAVATVVVWGLQEHRLHALWYAMYGFRIDATAVMDSGPLTAPETRLFELLGLAVIGGVGYLVAGVVAGVRRDVTRGGPLSVAILAGLLAELVGVALGASYWPHYLIQLVPMTALGCGVVCARPGRVAGWVRRLAVAAAATAVVVTPVVGVVDAAQGRDAVRVGDWVAASARSRDSLVVTYSHPNVLEASGLQSPYPYAWSLPVRTLDSHLARLDGLVSGPRAPTWVVEWDEFDAWGLDPHGTFGADISRHYHLLDDVCGHRVWLHDGAHRHPAPMPVGCDPAFGEG